MNKIVVLSGSTKFKKEFQNIAACETLKGNIVLTVHVFRHEKKWRHLTEDQLSALDTLYERMIKMAHLVLVINKDGYVGDGTKKDIAFANSVGVPVEYAFNEGEDKWPRCR